MIRRPPPAPSPGRSLGSIDAIMANTPPETRDAPSPGFSPPVDLQALKAAGVTFATSMLERVIEERARGNPGGGRRNPHHHRRP